MRGLCECCCEQAPASAVGTASDMTHECLYDGWR
jgi:hypothetical protein